MSPQLSEKEMIIESYLTLKQIEKRLDRHGVEHREDLEKLRSESRVDMDKLWSAMKEVGKSHTELSEDHGERLTKLESERGLVGKAMTAVAGFFAGVGGGWLGKHL